MVSLKNIKHTREGFKLKFIFINLKSNENISLLNIPAIF